MTGALTGLGVAAFDRLAGELTFDRLLDAPLWVQAVAPAAGLTVALVVLRTLGRGATPSTADEYIRDFHDAEGRLALRPVPARLLASVATLGAGGALGYEGPSIYLGAAIGSALQRRFSRFFGREDAKLLVVCGAAAGVAAIFKAPATGLVFALEVPYRQDLARRMLLPAMFASATSYVVFAGINGTAPLFPAAGTPAFDLRDLGGAAVLGVLCGLGARWFTRALLAAKAVAASRPATVRIPVAGAALALAFAGGRLVTGQSLVIGSGYEAIAWSLDPTHAIAAIIAVFALRALATWLAVAGGGVGGLFVPLVTQGALIGGVLGTAVDAPDVTLFPLLGVAAFLGAGYRAPLAAVVFVAESTGRPGVVVPGLLAAAKSQLLMGRWSASAYQQDVRTGMLERRLRLPLTSALRTDAATVPPDAMVTELFDHHIVQLRLRAVPVVDGATYRGMVLLDDVAAVPREEWPSTPVGRLARLDWPTAAVSSTLGEAVALMEDADVDRLPVLDGDAFVGVITTGEILKLDAILERAEDAG